ncbi:CcdB family protein [Rhizobium sp. BE258]|uniref:CcdB family protein n=1 Tax=Rhizobium sp. BE258 TaxID=2817722 RepID=UPI00286C0B58|nr:CcdB family protein [Rhizobium sp. BE258]
MRPRGQLAIDLQSNALEALPSRMMAPLYAASNMSWSISRLNPRFMIGGEAHVGHAANGRYSNLRDRRCGYQPGSRGGRHHSGLDFLFQGL